MNIIKNNSIQNSTYYLTIFTYCTVTSEQAFVGSHLKDLSIGLKLGSNLSALLPYEEQICTYLSVCGKYI